MKPAVFALVRLGAGPFASRAETALPGIETHRGTRRNRNSPGRRPSSSATARGA